MTKNQNLIIPYRAHSTDERNKFWVHTQGLNTADREKFWKSTIPEAKRIVKIFKDNGFNVTKCHETIDPLEGIYALSHVFQQGQELILGRGSKPRDYQAIGQVIYWSRSFFKGRPVSIYPWIDKSREHIQAALNLAAVCDEAKVSYDMYFEWENNLKVTDLPSREIALRNNAANLERIADNIKYLSGRLNQ